MPDTKSIVFNFCKTNRTPVSDASNELIEEVVKILKGSIISSKSGEEILTWLTPKHWNVEAAYIANMAGERLIDFQDNPLHLWTHAISFDGILSPDELKAHILYDEMRPGWIPYHYRNGYKYNACEWGFSVTYEQWQRLEKEKQLRVHIKSTLSEDGTLLVGDCVATGEQPSSILFSAHSCHPAIASDGLSNIAVLVELFKNLQARDNKYTYRFVVGPEYYAAALYLAKASPVDIKNTKGCIYLDMLGNRQNICFQSSFQENSILDRVVKNVFEHNVEGYKQYKYRKLWGNDEMFYNGPGYHIPSVGIGGDKHPEYHFHVDDENFIDYEQLKTSVALLLRIIDVFECDYIPVLNYRGPLCLSRYNLYIDPKVSVRGYELVEYMQILASEGLSCFETAERLDADFFYVLSFFEQLYTYGLITKKGCDLLNK